MIKINGHKIPYSIRTGGEIHLTVPPSQFIGIEEEGSTQLNTINIEAYLWSSHDIMALLLIFNALSERYTAFQVGSNLIIYYLPYARQDRVCNPGEPFSLKLMMGLLSCHAYPLDSIYFVDPHSSVVKSLADANYWPGGAHVVDQYDLFCPHIDEKSILVAPDRGAKEKINKFNNKNKIYISKFRDPCTRHVHIDGIDFTEKGEFSGEECNIVLDDICDGGRTYIEVAKALKLPREKLRLITTYGIYSNGVAELLEHYSEIGCMFLNPNVLSPWAAAKIKVYSPPTLCDIINTKDTINHD